MDSMEDCVERGAMLLDRERPGWAGGVDLDELDMATDEDCILGQLHGHYSIGRDSLIRRLSWYRRLLLRRHDFGWCHGFNAASSRGPSLSHQYDELQRLWAAEVMARRSAGTVESVPSGGAPPQPDPRRKDLRPCFRCRGGSGRSWSSPTRSW
jgi:hypothetical protein